MSAVVVHCKVDKSSSPGRWILVIMILCLLHIITVIWLIQAQAFSNLFHDDTMQNRQMKNKVNSIYADSEEVHRRSRALTKSCARFQRKLQKCKLTRREPVFAAQSQKKVGPVIQLVGKENGETLLRRNKIVNGWDVELNTPGFQYNSADGYIEVTKDGYYFMYAQMIPSLFPDRTEGEMKWEFSIHLKGLKRKADIAFAKVAIPDCNECDSSTMILNRIVKLEKTDKLGLKIIDGTKWWSSKGAQIFGIYAL